MNVPRAAPQMITYSAGLPNDLDMASHHSEPAEHAAKRHRQSKGNRHKLLLRQVCLGRSACLSLIAEYRKVPLKF